MTSAALPFALRETRAHLARPVVLASLCGVGLVLGLSGPFETYAAMAPLPRIGYWLAVTFATYAIGLATGQMLSRLLQGRSLVMRRVLVPLGITLTVTPVLVTLNAALGIQPATVTDLALILGTVLAVTLALQAVGMARDASGPASPPPIPPSTPQPLQPPALLDRLPLHKRGALLALSVSDHYVDVITTHGHEMLLMRLSDAIRETAGTPGLHVHRSHWVARAQILRVERMGERGLLTLQGGLTIPVSRTGMRLLRAEGLLPATSR